MQNRQGRNKIRVPDEIAEPVQHFHPQLKAKIKAALKDILEDPACGKALKDDLEGLRSYRVKRFRIIYRISRKCVELVAIGPRRFIYEETFRIISREEK
jgi:mRNA interferase RelE/StbE